MKPFMLRKKKKLVTVTRTNGLSARMDDTDDYRMVTIDSLLRGSLADRGGDLVLTLDPAFQGLPDTAHGGSVLAAFAAFAGLLGPREISGAYLRRVPLATPLRLARGRVDGAHTFVLSEDDVVLVDGRVAPAAVAQAGGGPGPLRDPLLLRGTGRSASGTSATGPVASLVPRGPGPPPPSRCPSRARASPAAATTRSA